MAGNTLGVLNKGNTSPALNVSALSAQSGARRRIIQAQQTKNNGLQKDAQLKAEDIAKIFGTQDNFNMIKSLLDSQPSVNKRPGASRQPLFQSQSKPTATAADIKVEQAMLDLHEMKTALIEEPPAPMAAI